VSRAVARRSSAGNQRLMVYPKTSVGRRRAEHINADDIPVVINPN
jgi:hypothetical protein